MFALKFPSLRTLPVAGILLGAALFGLASHAQDYPSKPLRWIVGYPAGGGSDVVVRLIAQKLGERLGQSVVVENRPGAGALVATEAAAKSKPDGYTLLSADNGVLVFNPLLRKKLPYDVARDFSPVSLYAKFPILLVVNPHVLPADSVQSYVKLAKAGAVSYASSGQGGPHHLAGELFRERTGAPLVHVPYGSAALTADLAGGHIGSSFIGVTNGIQLANSGKVRILAVMEAQRLKSLPDVPTMDEAGVKNLVAFAWQGVVVPAGTPANIIQRLHTEISAILQSPELTTRFRELGVEQFRGAPEEMGALIDSDIRLWGEVIRKRGITLDN